jgi:hypothetical protein
VAQLKAALGLTKNDVGLGSADNTSDAAKPVSTATQTALDAKQPLDSDLTTIAGLTATTDNFMVGAASAWASRTPAQAKTSLALAKADVGLGNVDNTSDATKNSAEVTLSNKTIPAPILTLLQTDVGSADKGVVSQDAATSNLRIGNDLVSEVYYPGSRAPISSAQQTALNGKQPLDADLTTIAGLTATTDNFMVAAASAWASRTPAQAKTSLALVKGDVGLGSVDNTSDAGKPVSTAQQTALDAKAPVGAKYITQTADGTLTAEQALDALATGILKSTTTTGVLSIAVGADLPAHTHAEADTTNLTTDLSAKATAGAALTEAAEANSTPVAGGTSTALGSGIRVFAFFTLPTTEKWYVITGIEWLNKGTVNGNVWCGVEAVDARPPVGAGTVNVAVGAPVAQAGTSAAQRNSRIASKAIRGGTILGVWFVSDSATGTFGNTAVTSANNRKTLAAGAPATADNTAWGASTAGYYVKAYFRGIN